MSKFRSIKNSLIGGEISPSAQGRTDLPIYQHSCKTLRNMIPFLSGGAYQRPGTLFQDYYQATTTYAPRVFPFIFSKYEAYALVFQQNTGTLAGSVSAYRPVDSNSTSTTSSVTGTHPYSYKSFSSGIVDRNYYDELQEVQYAQSADVMYLVHGNRKPQRIYRTAKDTFRITEFDHDSTGTRLTTTAFRDAWPFLAENTTAITMTISNSAVGSGRTLTASAGFFNSLHVGAVFKVYDGVNYGCCQVTAYTSSTVVTVDVVSAFNDTAAHSTWWESAWSDYRGWPKTVCFFRQRIIYGGSTSNPDTLWFSQTSNYNVMSVSSVIDPASSPTGSQPFSAPLNSNQVNLITWMVSERTLIVGTSGDEWVIDKENVDPTVGFGCDNKQAYAQSHYGGGLVQAQGVGNELFFCLRNNLEIKSLSFNQIQNSYVGESVQLLFDHYPKVDTTTYTNGNRKIKNISWDSYRNTLWCIDTAGNLFGMTRDKNLQVTCWHEHQMGGFDSTLTGGAIAGASPPNTGTVDPAYTICSGSVISIATVPNAFLGGNDLWMIVKRKINGSFLYHLERMIGRGIPYETAYGVNFAAGFFFVDSCRALSNDYPSTEDYTFSTLDHLEGQSLYGTATDLSRGLYVVTTGAVTAGSAVLNQTYPPDFDTVGYEVVLGLPFSSVIEPVRIEAGSQIGTSQAAIKRIHQLTARLFKTMSVKIGETSADMEDISFRTGTTPMSNSSDLFTGDKFIYLRADYGREGLIYITNTRPLPFSLISVIAEGVTSDG